MNTDAYHGEPNEAWLEDTKKLISGHPLFGQGEQLLLYIKEAWDAMWETQVGSNALSVPLRDLSPRAQIVGDFFESVLALRLSKLGHWKRGTSKQKDLIFTGNIPGNFDFEIKTSGQATGKIYGNRSYAQVGEDGKIDSPSRKERSGFYLCVNFFEQTIYHIRVGWIDASDWKPQESATGQMAGLKDHVYKWKLITIYGEYCLSAPLLSLDGLGGKTCEKLEQVGFANVRSILEKVSPMLPQEEIKKRLISVGLDVRTAGAAAKVIFKNSYLEKASIFLLNQNAIS